MCRGGSAGRAPARLRAKLIIWRALGPEAASSILERYRIYRAKTSPPAPTSHFAEFLFPFAPELRIIAITLYPTVVKRMKLFTSATTSVGNPNNMVPRIGVLNSSAIDTFCKVSLIKVSRIEEVANIQKSSCLNFRIIPERTPISPIMMAMRGVQAPGRVAMSEITIIEAPVVNPSIGPRVKPLMNVIVSVKPTAMAKP